MTYAILGSGAIGTALARRFVAKGIDIAIANTRSLESLAGLVRELGSNVTSGTASEVPRPTSSF
jgi:predicted dinucleotide-binding enzyme